MRCPGCPIQLPICAGEQEPVLCHLGGKVLADRSKWLSSQAGYPGPVRIPPVPPPPRSQKELVVARYQEDLSWIPNASMHATIYNKGVKLRSLPPHSREEVRPNVGRDAETILHHIIVRYDDLADVTFFAQGDPFPHSPDFLQRLRCDYREPASLTSRYTADFPCQAVKDLDQVSWHCGHEIRLGVANGYEVINQVSEYHHDPGRVTHTAEWLDRVWGSAMAGTRPEPTWLAYGCQWAVPREAILRRPLETWRGLRDLVVTPGHVCDAWGIEVLLYYLFAPPELYPDRWCSPVHAPKAKAKIATREELMRRAATGASRPKGGCCGG